MNVTGRTEKNTTNMVWRRKQNPTSICRWLSMGWTSLNIICHILWALPRWMKFKKLKKSGNWKQRVAHYMYYSFYAFIMKGLRLLHTGIARNTQNPATYNFLFVILFFTITAEIHARSLLNFYCQYAERHMNLDPQLLWQCDDTIYDQ